MTDKNRDENDFINLLTLQTIDLKGYIFRGILFVILLFTSFKLLGAGLNVHDVYIIPLAYINLLFHEAGHLIFFFLPSVGVSFMGSGMQLLIPLVCGLNLFIKTKDKFGAAFCFWWLGQNLLEVAVYMGDANKLTLTLIGGWTGRTAPYGFHDWQYIFTELNLIHRTDAIATATFILGKFIILAGLVWGGGILINSFKNLKNAREREFFG